MFLRFKSGWMAALLLSSTVAMGQKGSNVSDTVSVHGSCEMCKQRIETAGAYKKTAKVAWDGKTQKAILTYDPSKTDKQAILKRIALAGYDNESFRAPDDVYAKLPQCCKYRVPQKETAGATMSTGMGMETHAGHQAETHAGHGTENHGESQLQPVFDAYFMLKDALVEGDNKKAGGIAAQLKQAIKTVKMEKLAPAEHDVWMKLMPDLASDAEHIAESKDIAHQRDHFMSLSKNLYTLMTVAKPEKPVYYQQCPMANNGKGANWLSRESGIRNPYLGAQMLTCGKTVETIKKQ